VFSILSVRIVFSILSMDCLLYFVCMPKSCINCRGVMIHFFHKRYVLRYLICIMIRIAIRFIGNCNYSLKSMLVDMGAAMFFFSAIALCVLRFTASDYPVKLFLSLCSCHCIVCPSVSGFWGNQKP
jgi:hypothetical protein